MSAIDDTIEQVRRRWDEMREASDVFRVDIDGAELWETYLNSFPEGSNPLYKTRTEHDCACCRHFIRDVGNAVAFDGDRLATIWDVAVSEPYQTVVDALAKKVRSGKIVDIFSNPSATAGVRRTHQKLENGDILEWRHFHCSIPPVFVKRSPSDLNAARSTVDVFRRGVLEFSDSIVESVLDLIQENNLYRGEEWREPLLSFLRIKRECAAKGNPDWFFWKHRAEIGARLRNTVIGSLLQDLADGRDLEDAVKSYETKVAPANYKRPTSIVSRRMVEDAMNTVKSLGLEPAFHRRFARIEDLSVNNVLWADRGTAPAMRGGLFNRLLDEISDRPHPSKEIQGGEIGIEEFVRRIAPKTSSMEALFENRHATNLVSLIAPLHDDAPRIFRWGNGFSWSYRGNVADSIKERVKAAGGNVDAFLRISLAWHNYDDLDLHVEQPQHGRRICFYDKHDRATGGFLDVDMNAGSGKTREAVENIAWADPKKMLKGIYCAHVNNYQKRENDFAGFEIQIESAGEIHDFSYTRSVPHKATILAARFSFDGERISSIESGPNVSRTKRQQTIWGISTEKFHKVQTIMLSPNHWDGEKTGNKHWFFFLEGCKNDERPRGFYNEYLDGKLERHRKVFEILGDKTKCEMSLDQVGGIGFSSTKRDFVVCKCDGRIWKVAF